MKFQPVKTARMARMDLFLWPYVKVVGSGIARLLAMIVLDIDLARHEPPDTRTSVLGDINPARR